MAFDLSVFRELYPAFATASDAAVSAAAGQAACYIGTTCADDCAIYLMVAHLLANAQKIALGQQTGQVTSATVDKVAVTVAQAPGTDSYRYWLNGTPYGQQLLALLARCAVGGAYVGGSAERAAFRSVGGVFPRGGRIW